MAVASRAFSISQALLLLPYSLQIRVPSKGTIMSHISARSSFSYPIMSDSLPLPLCEKTSVKVPTLQRALEIGILFLFTCLIAYRLFSLTDHGIPWLLAFLCESWFAFNWVLNLITLWTPMDYKTYPNNLLQQ